MATTSAGSLLRIYSIRMRMQEDGITNPSARIRILTRQLVEKLSQIDESEQVEIKTSDGDKLPAQFIRQATGEVLVEIDEEAGELSI